MNIFTWKHFFLRRVIFQLLALVICVLLVNLDNLPKIKYDQTFKSNVLNQSNRCEVFEHVSLQSGFSISDCKGRLGNQLGVLSLGLPLYLKFGVKLLLSAHQAGELASTFNVTRMCKEDFSSFCITRPDGCEPSSLWIRERVNVSQPEVWKESIAVYSSKFTESEGLALQLPKTPTYWKWLVKDKDLLQQFRSSVIFRDDVWDISQNLYRRLRDKCDTCQMVGVHLRMGDYDNYLKIKGLGPNILTGTNYLQMAIFHLKQQYQNPLFYFLSQDTELMVEFLERTLDVETLQYEIPGLLRDQLTSNTQIAKGIDLALLSAADTVIFTYGTFGLYGALLDKDKEVLYPKFHPTNHIHELGFDNFIGIAWNETAPPNSI